MSSPTNIKMIIRISTILLLPVSTMLTAQASNTVSIIHRSIGTRDYTQGLNVVRTNVIEDQEYVTSFYKRVQSRVKDRDGLFTPPESSVRDCEERPILKKKPFTLFQKTAASQDAAGVRGGAASSLKLQSAPPLTCCSDKSNHRHKKTNGFKSPSFRQKSRHPNEEQKSNTDDMYYFPQYDDDEYLDDTHYQASNEEDQDDYPPGEHHLGLLRVPCSIAINSGEDGRLQHSSGRGGGVEDQYVKKTPIAAYVDTGAQVTVISASAARRAGILHLMDRRYAGRATGVGHCKVLGRIPARHVYFVLGDDGEVSCRGGVAEHGGSTVQMDGPALTVLEGTVTKGVDLLLGLDVLQDWEAEIRMGANKSITVKKRQGRNSKSWDEDSVVIPFACHRGDTRKHSNIINQQSKARQHASTHHHQQSHHSHQHSHQAHHNSMATQFHRRHHHHESQTIEDDDEYFSPAASDIESDLDLLEQTIQGDELEEDADSENLPIQDDIEDEDDGYLKDVEDEDLDEDIFDMSGL